MWAPALSSKEALLTEIEEFAAASRPRAARPLTDGQSGLRVVEMLDRRHPLHRGCAAIPSTSSR